ncbi:hypothetical protein JT358_11590 [Micrococcales bacterium 31B]|nr:hypothetical protein [Micrococcales bacterium 31B]
MSVTPTAPRPLVTLAQAKALGLTITDDSTAQELLDLVCGSVLDAIGQPVLRRDVTFSMLAPREERFVPPLQPCNAVRGVSIDGVTDEDWFFAGGYLVRPGGWASSTTTRLEITADVGFDKTPATITQIVLSLLGGGLAALEEGSFGTDSRVRNERIDDYGVGYAVGDDAVASPIEVPARTRTYLRSVFGPPGDAGVVETYQ